MPDVEDEEESYYYGGQGESFVCHFFFGLHSLHDCRRAVSELIDRQRV